MKTQGVFIGILRLLIIVFAIHIAEAMIVGGLWYALDLQAQRALATKLNIEPNWTGLEKYIEGHIKVGMSREEVIKQAIAIGPFTVKPLFSGAKYCEIYFFNVGPFETARGQPWWICYDENNKVISVEQYWYQ
jgi:hypothetical protein